MTSRPFNPAQGTPAIPEIRIDRDGPGRRNWRWSLWCEETLIARCPDGFSGAEEAYEAGRMALQRPVRGPATR